MKIICKSIIPLVCITCLFSYCSSRRSDEGETGVKRETTADIRPVAAIKTFEPKTPPSPSADVDGDPSGKLTNEEIELIALVTMAEAEGECEEGKRLVIDTILNRVDSDRFPDTVHDVVYQKYHFSSMWNGRVERCEVREDICDLVKEELKSRTNYDVMYFTAGRYSEYGVPMFQVGNHYFSKDE